MKELLIVLLVSGALSEAPAPYAPSGWRPSGPAFELPTKAPSQDPQRAQYLPPVDPRNNRPLGFDPVADVSVQGLPTQEQLPIFQVSPINGQQYVGPNFNSDIKGLEQNFQQSQFQLQQEKARQLARQQQFPANPNSASGLPNQQPPRQFAQTTPAPTTTARPKQAEPTTESSLNKDEKPDKDTLPKKAKISVEVSKQNLQEYPPEFFLSSLAQLQLQPQFVPLQQFGQIREQVFYQPTQQAASAKQTAGYDGPTHFAALPSVLAQNQIAPQQPLIPAQQPIIQKPALLVQQTQQPANPIIVQAEEPLPQYQPVAQYQPIAQPQLNQEPLPQYQPVNQYQPIAQEPLPQYQPLPNQYQPALQAQEPLPQYQPVNQYQPIAPQQLPQATPVVYQPQPNLPPQNPQAEAVETNEQQPQFIYQQTYQPQEVYQPQQSYQPQEVYQPQQAYQPQIQTQYTSQQGFIPQNQVYPQDLTQYYQNQYPQQLPNQFAAEPIVQGQDALQSGLDVSKEDNDIDQEEQDEEDDGTKATAVATAFGARTQPRVFSQYGVPVSNPRDQADRGYPTTTESDAEETTEEAPAVAQATAVATPSRNRSAKLRSRRPRPLFTVDRSGHLVLAKDQ